MEAFSRIELLLGQAAMARLTHSTVAVFGLGGVGGHCAEALARSGIGHLVLIDSDAVATSNLNRQLIATQATIGMPKVEALEQRLLAINPQLKITKHCCFFLPENQNDFDFTTYDYVVDAVDTVAAKVALAVQCHQHQVPIISSMGAGNKLHPELFEITDIYKTSVCPLARVMRQELKKRGIPRLTVVYSKELPLSPAADSCSLELIKEQEPNRRTIPGSTAFTPSVAGLIMAGQVIRHLAEVE